MSLTSWGEDTITTSGDFSKGIRATHEGTGNIEIDLKSNTTITTSGGSGWGIEAYHIGQGEGDIMIEMTGGSIKTMGASSFGISAIRGNANGEGQAGDVTVNITDAKIEATASVNRIINVENGVAGEGTTTITLRDTTIKSGQAPGPGVRAARINGTGVVTIDIEDSDFTTTGLGIYGEQYGTGTGAIDLDIGVRGGSITTTGASSAHGIHGFRNGNGTGGIDIDARNVTITTKGTSSYGVSAYNSNETGVIDIDARNVTITTKGTLSHGIYGQNTKSTSAIEIDLQGVTIKSESDLLVENQFYTASHGVWAYHQGDGDISIDARTGTAVITKGAYSYGLRAFSAGAGDIQITTHEGSSITTTGASGHGIDARNTSTSVMDDTRSITITVGGDITASGENALGVQIGTGSGGFVGLDEDGYRRQTVTVNGRVTGGSGTGAGIYLSNGGKVFIGPQGSVGAGSGIAILATGDMPVEGGDPIKPKLYLDMNLAGRRVTEVIGTDYILNDGGETTIVVNDVLLHDGATGVVPNVVAANGARNVTMREHGFKVDDRTAADPGDWVRTASTSDVKIIADRDFSAEDFTETARPRPPPPPPSCPAGQVGTPPDCEDPPVDPEIEDPVDPETMEPAGPMFMEEYAPRSAVYESLPGLLLRMGEQGPLDQHPASAESPVWVAVTGGSGSVNPDHSTVDADYDYDRFMVQLGKNLTFDEALTGRFAVHFAQGDTDVSSPTGDGDIDVDGIGATFVIQWQYANGYYFASQVSMTDYDIDLSSDQQGRLKNGVDAFGYSLGFETGRRMSFGQSALTPRAWLSHSSVDIDGFTDSVGARASFSNEERITAGLGVIAETMRPWQAGELSLRGTLDIEQRFGNRGTTVDVSGEKLTSESDETRIMLGLGSTYRRGDFSISGQISVDGLDTDDREYTGQVILGVRM